MTGVPMKRARASSRLPGALSLAVAALLASCAPIPPAPTPPGVPPVPGPVPPVPAPAPTPSRPAPLVLDGEPLITVGLAWDLDTVSLVPAPGLASARARWAGGRALPARGTLRLRPAAGGIRVEVARGEGWETEFVAARRETCWLAGPDLEAETAAWNGKRWRGALGVFENSRGRLTLVARLPLECYLRGVVPGEIGALGEDRIEAGKAQAISARSYTLFYMGRRAAEGFDLFATVEDQLYSPIEDERPLASRCVDETRGQVALWEGQPVRANYSSTCGGISAEAWEAWPTGPLPYLASRRDRRGGEDWCSGSTHYRWRETWSADEFLGNLARFGRLHGVPLPPGGLGTLVDVRVASRSRSGRVWRLEVTTTAGRVVVPAHVLRLVLRRGGQPGPILRSTLFKVAVRRDPATRAARAVVASGAGSGHGVGLCQTGALGMARGGVAARDILLHYYPGSQVRALY